MSYLHTMLNAKDLEIESLQDEVRRLKNTVRIFCQDAERYDTIRYMSEEELMGVKRGAQSGKEFDDVIDEWTNIITERTWGLNNA